MQVKPGSIVTALALCCALAVPALVSPAWAADPAEPPLKTAIEDFLERLDASTHGLLKWEGADRMEIRQEGDAAVAAIANARIRVRSPEAKPGAPSARVSFDHIEIRRTPAPEDGVSLAVVFPRESIWHNGDGGETRLTLTEATGHAIIDAQSSRARETGLAFAGARLDDKATGDWITVGPLSLSWKVVGGADGGWTTPVDFELKRIEFSFTGVPVGGTIERIAYNARTAGPDLAALNRLRDRVDQLRQEGDRPPAARLEALLDMLPEFPSLLSLAKGEMTVEGVVARAPKGERLVTLATASIGAALTGLSGEAAALRITVKHDRLALAPAILDGARVPQRVVLDFGVEEVATAALRSILEAAKSMREGASDADKTRGTMQMLGAAAMLNPVLRLYDLALDTPGVGVDATAEAKGSPLSPKGYSAAGDVAVRGFDALPSLLGAVPLASYLPLLKEIGTAASAADGTPRTNFHLASAPPKWITLNGSDVAAWFAGNSAGPGEPRALRPAEPAMTGADVRAVQKALAAAKLAAPQTGAYDGATAAAVARFQKENALNIDGVVDPATRRKLGIKAEPAPAQPGGSPPGRRG
jgi:hypothetical protein